MLCVDVSRLVTPLFSYPSPTPSPSPSPPPPEPVLSKQDLVADNVVRPLTPDDSEPGDCVQERDTPTPDAEIEHRRADIEHDDGKDSHEDLDTEVETDDEADALVAKFQHEPHAQLRKPLVSAMRVNGSVRVVKNRASFHEFVVVAYTWNADQYDRTSTEVAPLTKPDLIELLTYRAELQRHTQELYRLRQKAIDFQRREKARKDQLEMQKRELERERYDREREAERMASYDFYQRYSFAAAAASAAAAYSWGAAAGPGMGLDRVSGAHAIAGPSPLAAPPVAHDYWRAAAVAAASSSHLPAHMNPYGHQAASASYPTPQQLQYHPVAAVAAAAAAAAAAAHPGHSQFGNHHLPAAYPVFPAHQSYAHAQAYLPGPAVGHAAYTPVMYY
ncbi:hypothetical protein BDK51DRAFT_47091 [Blyttiomyces helicus]|uniref:Uncharacterized protein n=1 Tax=Blyttiomyces helicus TaxID=388810 RepID=A0A4P9W6Q1_9FUNG|nr:hypothetical protein BDK51DRAFT_47091 [Blyttiomyces helicus]|eukprot:RKO88141.1 hypothetical protein BDK51DRAFT_47091 [Blyttiomyces helicus]